MAKKNKIPTGKQARKMGYTSFTEDKFTTSDTTNARANELFLEMLQVPKKVQKKVAKGKSHKVNDNDYYPVSMEETLQMERLLNQTYSAVTDRNDGELMGALDEMRDIIDWSKTRQWNFQWAFIIGVILFVCFLWWQTGDAKKEVERYKAEMAKYEKGDPEVLKAYKENQINSDTQSIESYTKTIADYKARLDTVKNKEQKKQYEGYVKDYEKLLAEKKQKVAELKTADNKGIQKIAMAHYKEYLKRSKGSHRSMFIWTLFFILLIPVYVIAERPYGYMISKHRLESKILGWIRKIMFWLAGSLVGGAMAMQVTETVTTWSDGSKTTDSDAIPVYVMKIILLIAALCIFVFTSVALMLYATIVGLIRNYELKAEAQKMFAKVKK
jgi:hypothetical protein